MCTGSDEEIAARMSAARLDPRTGRIFSKGNKTENICVIILILNIYSHIFYFIF